MATGATGLRRRPPAPLAALPREWGAAILGSLGILLFLAGWEAVVYLRLADAVFISRPALVASAISRQFLTGQLVDDLLISVTEMALGFAMAAVVGVLVGTAMGWYRSVEYALDPFVWVLYSAPLVAFYPLFIIWLVLAFN